MGGFVELQESGIQREGPTLNLCSHHRARYQDVLLQLTLERAVRVYEEVVRSVEEELCNITRGSHATHCLTLGPQLHLILPSSIILMHATRCGHYAHVSNV